jgi:hypothetical protein
VYELEPQTNQHVALTYWCGAERVVNDALLSLV